MNVLYYSNGARANNNITTPKVSVVIPCYNASATLDDALRSTIDQNFESLEIILVDDGSTDSSLRIMHTHAANDPRIRVISRVHEGIIATLNAGVDASNSPYIARMDADDYAYPDRIAKQAAYLDNHPEIAVVGCLVEGFPHEEIGVGFKLYLEWLNRLINHEEIIREIFIESPLAHPSVMFRKAWSDKVGGYQDMGWAEDYDLWLRLYLAEAKFGKVPETLLSWREHSNRLTRTDPRYSVDNFLRAKAYYLRVGPLIDRDAVILWGAGQTGRRFSKFLLNQGVPVVSFIDVDPAKVGRERRGFPILHPDDLLNCWRKYRNPVVLVAVAARGARKLIREHLVSIGLEEGADWWAVA